MSAAADPQLADYGRFVLRHWPMMLALALTGVILGGVTFASFPVTYTSTVAVLTSGTPLRPATEAVGRLVRKETMDTEVQLVLSDRVLERLAQQTGANMDDVRKHVVVSVALNTRVMTIATTASSPQEARAAARVIAVGYLELRAKILNDLREADVRALETRVALLKRRLEDLLATAGGGSQARVKRQTLRSQITDLEQRIAGLAPPVQRSGDIVRAATLPRAPDTRNRQVSLASGGALGLLAALALALIGERTPRRVRGRSQVHRAVSLISDEPAFPPPPVLAVGRPSSRGLDPAYWRLRNLFAERGITSVLLAGVGTAAVLKPAVDLAATCAGSGSATTLLMIQAQHGAAGVAGRSGPIRYESGSDSGSDRAPFKIWTVRFAPGIDDHALAEAVANAARTADQLVVAGPASHTADALMLGAHIDAVVLVAERGQSTDQAVAADTRTLNLVGGTVCAILLTRPSKLRWPFARRRGQRPASLGSANR